MALLVRVVVVLAGGGQRRAGASRRLELERGFRLELARGLAEQPGAYANITLHKIV